MVKEITIRVCEVCGKEFEMLGKAHKKTCSPECKAEFMRRYHRDYHKNRYHKDEEYRTRLKTVQRKNQLKTNAKNRWEKQMEYANQILELSKMDNPQELIATYLKQNFIRRGSHIKTPNYVIDEELKARETYESLGDIMSK